MPTPFDRKPFAERYHVNDYGVFFRITHTSDDGRIFGRNVRADNIQSVAGRRLLPKQIAYILHHGELPKFIIHKNRDQDDMRKDNLLGSDVHPRWANYEGVDVTTVRYATATTGTPAPTAHDPDGYLSDLDK